MVDINLLPWREEERRYQRKQSQFILLTALMISLMPMLGLYFNLVWQEKEAAGRVASLERQANRIAEKTPDWGIKKTVSSSFLQQQSKNKKLFESLSRTREAKLCFNKIMRVNQKVFFSGYAHSALDLTNFLMHWQALTLFSEIKIEQMEQQKNHLRFQLQAV